MLSIDALLNGEHGQTRWNPALSNEWGRLAQGNCNGIISTDTIDFIPFHLVPKHKKTTYVSFVCSHRPLKEEEWRIRYLVGGDKLEWHADT